LERGKGMREWLNGKKTGTYIEEFGYSRGCY
jgi:hypothetical protein